MKSVYKKKCIKSAYKKVFMCILWQIMLSSSFYPIYAGTVDDVRELLGRERLDKRYTESEILEVTKNYIASENNNLVAEMFKLGENIKMEDYETDKIQLLNAIDRKRDELNKAFSTAEPLDTVLRLKTELDNLLSDVARLKEVGYEVKVEYEPNPYTEDYMRIQGLVEELGEQYNIGDIGGELESPLLGSFVITSPFGTRIDPFTGIPSIHNALDLSAQHRQPVLAQWNGIVTKAYLSESGGNMVVISHGKDFETTYMHMDELIVKAGDYVNQYDVIGYAGTTGRSTGTHLHLEIKLDGVSVNPLMLYGNKGLNALKTWITLNPNELEDTSFMVNVKDKPEDFKSEVEEIVKRGYQSYIAPTYERGESEKELTYKETMELNESKKEVKDEEVLSGVIEVKLPDDYDIPIPGIPYFDADTDLAKNENINEADIEDFNEYGQMHVQDDLGGVKSDSSNENGKKEFHLKTTTKGN